MAEALQNNFTLLAFRLRPSFVPNADAQLARNKALLAQSRTLASLARGTIDAGLHSLAELVFRSVVFSYFLPPTCRLAPKWPTLAKVQPGCPAFSAMTLPTQAPAPPPDAGVARASTALSARAVSPREELQGDVEHEVKMALALEASEVQDVERESEELARAIQLSKAELL